MATGKRYYWMKLKESFMTSDTIDYFMSQPDGANYVVLYQMLCLKTINTGGRLSRQIGEIIIPYDAEKIQRDCKWFSIDTVRVALKLYEAVGLIYIEQDGTLVLSDHESLVGSETDYSAQKRSQRKLSGQSRPSLPDGSVDNGVDNVHTDIEIDIENRDRDKSLDTDGRGKRKTTTQKADAFSEFAGDDADLLDALRDFEKMRKSIKKPMTDRAKKMLCNQLERDFSPSIWIEVLEQSISCCWQGIYPIKDHRETAQRNTVVDDLRTVHAMFEAEEGV